MIYPLVFLRFAIGHGHRKFIEIPIKNGDFPVNLPECNIYMGDMDMPIN